MTKKQLIIESLNGCRIRVERVNNQEYFCLTDLAGYTKLSGGKVIQQWIGLKSTIAFLSAWELRHNSEFRQAELGKGLSALKWVRLTNAIGIITKQGARSTWAHVDIATHFMVSLSVEFQLHTIKELRRLEEQDTAGSWLEPEGRLSPDLQHFMGFKRTTYRSLSRKAILCKIDTMSCVCKVNAFSKTCGNLYF